MKVFHDASNSVINVPIASEQEERHTGASDTLRLLRPAEHTHSREHQDAEYARLEAERKAFVKGGGKVTKVPSTI